MNSHAVHIEVTHSLDTDSFMQALRQMIQEEGILETFTQTMEAISSEQENELKRAFEEMDDKKIQVFMQELGGDWIKWK